jgi:hypothetical protein
MFYCSLIMSSFDWPKHRGLRLSRSLRQKYCKSLNPAATISKQEGFMVLRCRRRAL